MAQSRENLEKLLKLVSQVANESGNDWLLQQLKSNYGTSNVSNDKSIEAIYELCVKEIIQKQASNFYKPFKIQSLRSKLEADFIRMEDFRREDSFEDFSLALHQQIENIVNYLAESHNAFRAHIIENKTKQTYSIKKNGIYYNYDLSTLIFSNLTDQDKIDKSFQKDIFNWDYLNKLKSVIYYFIFNQKIYNYFDFKESYDIGNEIYQARNLNHRGGFLFDNQRESMNKIIASRDKNYFKFLGFLETFTTKVNDSLQRT